MITLSSFPILESLVELSIWFGSLLPWPSQEKISGKRMIPSSLPFFWAFWSGLYRDSANLDSTFRLWHGRLLSCWGAFWSKTRIHSTKNRLRLKFQPDEDPLLEWPEPQPAWQARAGGLWHNDAG